MDLFAKSSLLSIASAVGKPIAMDKSTQVRSRSSTARVKVILDLMDKHLDRIRLQNASACEIPSSFMESIGGQWDEFGYKLLFKGNEQDMNGVVVLSPTHSNNKVEAKSDQKSGTNIKSWADMAGDEKQASSSPICSKLSPAASEVVPIYAMILPSLAAEQLVAQTSAPLNAMDNPTKEFQAKRYDPRELIEDPMKAFEGDLGVDIFDEEDEDEVLDECFAKVARDRDLSPRQQKKGFKKKKTHERKHSWDGKVSEEVILRQLPMRWQSRRLQGSIISTRFNRSRRIDKI
ncbi:hypothetical protein BC332_19468 [Capsicum chinense]|nr:hypothetical protein BC332_19468 [Capsicum chinense]